MDLHTYLAQCRELIDGALDRYLPPADASVDRLHEALRYSVLAPGKRLRPVLVLAGAEAVGGDPTTVIPTACALECIHAFSLIHDDLPCMDDDDYRRGRLTSHKVFGEASALLAGDALLALAFELIAESAAQVPAGRGAAVVALIARASGTRGMVGGQVLDMAAEGRNVGGDALDQIHALKTGALITAAVTAGAMLCTDDVRSIEALQRYGQAVGLAFQIADDILDVVGDESKIGKPVGSDVRQDKMTYPRLYGIDESRRRAQTLVDEAIRALSPLGPGADPLRAIARYIVERDV